MPREQWWYAPASVQVSEEQLRGLTGHPDMCTHWDSQDNLRVSASCPQNLGVPALLGIEFVNLYRKFCSKVSQLRMGR